ncbi:MAG TPA: hypothetical protein VGR41_03480 [Actinomycetota bacterium]|jgi:hypothetical protein|nr:hypothetical protein [Actinomycetota bacterium]
MRESLTGFIIDPVHRLGLVVLAAAVLAACNGGTSSSVTTLPTPTASISSGESPSTTDTASESPSFPPLPSPVVALEHGGKYFVVYLGIGAPGSGALRRAERRFADHGITAVAGDLSCDQGAAESLGVEPGSFAVGAYFEREGDATTFAEALAPEGVVYGPVPVKTLCAD